MGRSRRDYNSYRGRRTLNDLLKVVAAVLLVLVLLVLALLFFGQDYLVVTDKGLEFDPPFFHSREEEPPDPGNVSVVIQPAGSTSEEEEEEEPVPDPVQAMTALELPVSAVVDGTAAGLLEQAGANALVVEMKGQEGRLTWSSAQAPAALGEINGDQGVNAALEEWNRGEVYTVARVCCFRDNSLPYQRNDMALRASYGNWRDELGLRWLNPDSADVRSYLAGLCGELAEMGFDEIVLDCCSFPVQGNREAILAQGSYATGQFAQTLEDFLAQVSQAVEPYGTALSIRCSREALTGEESGGLSAAVLEGHAARLWMEEDGGQPPLLQLLQEAGITGGEGRLVTEDPSGEGGPRAAGTLPRD